MRTIILILHLGLLYFAISKGFPIRVKTYNIKGERFQVILG
jgi:hypothetical protein